MAVQGRPVHRGPRPAVLSNRVIQKQKENKRTNKNARNDRTKTVSVFLGEHKPGRIKPGRIKRAALPLQNQHSCIFAV